MKGIQRASIIAFLSTLSFIILEKPAYANAPMTWGGIAGGAQAAIGFATGGIGFIAITIVESIVFRKYFSMTWGRSIFASVMINLISSAIGFWLANAAFQLKIPGLFVGALVTSILIYHMRYKGMPLYYMLIIIPTILIGFIGVLPFWKIIVQTNHLVIFGMMMLPLVLGFGLTLLYEGMVAGYFLPTDDFWKPLLIANCYSYLILAIALPFSPIKAQIDSQGTLVFEIQNQIVAYNRSPEQVVEIIRKSHGSNLYLLGLTSYSSPPPGYDGKQEERGLNYSYGHFSQGDPDPDIGIAVAEEALTYNSLTDFKRKHFEWTIDYLEHWKIAREAIIAGDQNALDIAYQNWKNWKVANPQPETVGALFPEPSEVIQLLVMIHKSDLEAPVEDAIEEN
ncbi:MAG: hypothetical protein NTY09_02105 [bacterium]|nr:hypothetical protein [bacterium]